MYTKGEWKAGKLYTDGEGDKVVDIMAETEGGDTQEWVAETWSIANAQLIASAPDLYEALKRSHRQRLDYDEHYPNTNLCKITKQALAKVESK